MTTLHNEVPRASLTSVPTRHAFNYIVIILMENRNYSDIIGNPSAPYVKRLAHDYSLVKNYHDDYHDVSDHFSLPNYLGLVAANTYDSWSACTVPPSACPGWKPVTDPTITDGAKDAGLSWKAYMKDMPSNCYQYDSGLYVARHDPFVYYGQCLEQY